MAFEKRWYQTRCENNIQKFLDDSAHQKGLIVHSVATGKSIIPSMVSGLSHKPTLVVQPTAELLDQNLEKARAFGFDPSVYSASRGSKDISDLTYATPMSIIKNPEHFKRFKIVVQDESHLMTTNVGVGKDAKKGKFNQFLDEISPEKILGMTATPIQLVSTGMGSELKMMNRSMRSFWYKADVVDLLQIQEISEYYWADVQIEQFDTESNFLKLNSTGAEFRDDSIIKQYEENNLDRDVLEKYDYLRSKGKNHILTFVPSVGIALRLAETNPDFEVVYGEMDKKERVGIINAFKAGNIPHLINVNTLTCLSEDTEVLTEDGWKSRDEVTLKDKVAQWEDGNITYANPLFKHEKEHEGNMVVLNGMFNSFRVTDDHDVLYTTSNTGKFMKTKAVNIINRRCYIPVSGFSEIPKLKVEQEALIKCPKWRFISQNSYNYRKKGMTYEESVVEAEKQYEIKSNLKFKNPDELTLDECRLIGFFLGDGCMTKPKGNGTRYNFCQSVSNQKIANWFENILNSIGIEYSKQLISRANDNKIIIGRPCKVNDHYNFSVCIGTGGYKQNRKGLYHLIPYLVKQGTHLYKGLNREQYFALMEGLFKADGSHGDNLEYRGQSIYSMYKTLLDLLQEIGVCRGYKVKITELKKREHTKNTLYSISLKNTQRYQISNDRAYLEKTKEKVWCLTMPKGTLITRQNGNVVVMGNCGFDYPELDGIIMARETSSFSLYYQKFGRIVRPIIKNGQIYKKQGLICDLTSNTKRFGNLKDITFEKNDYTNGWGMWSKDRLMTGSIIGDWDMPSRKSLQKKYESKGNKVVSKNEKTGAMIIGFGKYKGQDIEKSFAKNPGYYSWILNNFTWTPDKKELKQKIEFLLEQKLMHGS